MRFALTFLLLTLSANAFGQSAQEMAANSGVKGGLVVHIGSSGGPLMTDLLNSESFVVHGLSGDQEDVAKTREVIKKKNLYGKASVQYWNKKHFPYADGLVNLLVADDLGDVSVQEVMRVLAPSGVACIRSGDAWKTTTKPWPKEIDEWTHYLHGPDNNAVAQDEKVGLPKHVQWIGYPKFARSHEQLASVSAMVSAKGRIFCIIDEGLTADIRMPARWSLVARDAFSGVVLWKRKIPKWADQLKSFRSGPPDLPFRLVAVDDRVYVTLGIDQPVTSLDAASGKLVTTFKGTENTRQIIRTRDRLVMLAGSSQVAIHTRRGEKQLASRIVIAADPKTGETLWRKKISVDALLPLVATDDAILYQTRANLVCLNAKSGKENWKAIHPAAIASEGNNRWQWATPTLVAIKGVVYVADFRKLAAFSLDDGKALWDCSSTAGFNTPPDVFVIDDLLWRGYTGQRGSADFGEGRSAKTGDVERTFGTQKAWSYATLAHHRCYRPKATSRFILSSRSGVEYIDVKSGKVDLNHWLRGTCQYGVLPANGLLYAPPHSCACNIKTMVRGTWAFASTRDEPADAGVSAERLEKGPAFSKARQQTADRASTGDWPTFRHDTGRSGQTATSVPSKLKQTWKTKLGGQLTSPVVSGGKLFVAQVEEHTVHALDVKDGNSLWSFTAGGRIDSPPTIHNQLVLFGSTDGWVYCLREKDGDLVWRFRGAPKDRLIVDGGQLESAWPLHGSVLVHQGKAIVAAGRSSYVDGGIYVSQLEPATGKLISQTVINSLDPETGEQPAGGVDLRGVLNDVLAVSGDSVYMRHLKVDFEQGDDLRTGPPHLFAPMGFLDDAWWHRSYWLFASDAVCMPPTNESGWAIWARMGNMVPSGRILSLGDKFVYGYGRDRLPGGGVGQSRGGEKYHLFAAEKKLLEPLPSNRKDQHLRYARSGQKLGLKTTQRDRRFGEPRLHRNEWSQQMPIYGRALVLADTTLFLAGPPELTKSREGGLTLENFEKAEAAFQGKQGASLWSVSAIDGTPTAEYKLGSSPVFDGMIAAQQRLFLSLEDGTVVSFGK